MSKTKIYIAGKITGMEEEAFQLFQKAEDQLSGWHFEVVNPMKLPHKHDKTWQSYMDECIPALLECEQIYLLDNWHKSKGAKMELKEALRNGLKVRMQGDSNGYRN